MSELPNRISETLAESPPTAKEPPVSSQRESVPFLKRSAFVLGFVLTVLAMLTFTPQMAKKIAYSWNIGVERARAEVAKQFLADNPITITEQRIAWVARAVSPSVVGIQAITSRLSDPNGTRGRDGLGTLGTDIGSGVIVDPQGYILTNEHVIANAHVILVRLSDGRTVEAEIVGRNRPVDLAVLRIDLDDLEAIEWGDSRHVVVGEQVVAIGSPYDLHQTVTSGIISATERYRPALPVPTWGMGRNMRRIPQEFLQTDAAINPGNSGGALVDMNGRLIGICTAIMSEQGGNSGIGFAIPSFLAKRIYDEIVSRGEVQHGWIGVQFDNVSSFAAQRMDQTRPAGAVVARFIGRSPAREAGLQRGDIILRWGETEISDPLHLSHLVLLSEPGTEQTVKIFRRGEFMEVDITVGVRPTDL